MDAAENGLPTPAILAIFFEPAFFRSSNIRRHPSRGGDHACLERAWRCQSTDRRLRYVEASRHVGLRLAIRKPLNRFLPLMRRQGCRSAEFHPTVLRTVSAF